MNKRRKDAKILDSCEVKKIKQGMSYSGKEKTIIMNVFKYFCSKYPDTNITEIVRLTSRATGCSEKSIFSFRKEEVSPDGFREPSKTKVRRKINMNNRLLKYNERTQDQIKRIIYDLKARNESLSLNIILRHLSSNKDIPKFSLMTLRRLLSDMGFCYEKNGSKSILIEKLGCKMSSNVNEQYTQKISPTDSTSSEKSTTENSKLNAQIGSVTNTENHLICNAISSLQKGIIPSHKIDGINVQPYAQYHNIHKSHENFNENNLLSKGVPTHVPTASFRQDYYQLNKDHYPKEVQLMAGYPIPSGTHNTTLHYICEHT